jgi:DNA polymerase I-like protein with 3'-5' exonuclease and polymerase domains
MEFCEIKNRITDHTFKTHARPKNYEFLYELAQLVGEMSHKKLNIDLSNLKESMASLRTRQLIKKVKQAEPCIKYNIFGTKTGRLTTKKNSFPILTLDKSYRSMLKPNNDWFVEFDYNAAELRVLLGLLGKKQPVGDLHEWNAKNVYRDLQDREEAKKRIFAWLYNPNSKDYLSSRAYDRDSVVQKYYNQGQVSTFFNRTIPADDHHALNYIIQSTCSDLILRQAIKVNKLLENTKTNIAFMIHDSIILDMSADDEHMLDETFKTFANTNLGAFETNVKAGKNFGDMKKLWIHL